MRRVALITKHEKARWIAPSLAPLGYQVYESNLFDTDILGTFSGEVERILSPKDAALTKAKKACELTAADWGLGSEGSFGGGPVPGMINWNDELLCLYQASTGTVIYAHAAGPTSVQELTVGDSESLQQQLLKLPDQRWILKTDQYIEKGLSAEYLLDRLEYIQSFAQKVKIEPDLRAMNCPQRQKIILKAAEDLGRRLSAVCPICQAINFVIKEKQSGLPCSVCAMPTEQTKSWIRICDDCSYRNDEIVKQKEADPTHCQLCNP
jgi:hypothetical protein